MKILLNDERADALEFLWESIRHIGYNVGIARNSNEINHMLDDTHHDIVLTSGCYRHLYHDRIDRTKRPDVFVVGIKSGPADADQEADQVDQYLVRPFRRSTLLSAIEKTLRSGAAHTLRPAADPEP